MNIIKVLKNWFNKPYFLTESIKAKLLISFVLAFVVFFNLYFIRPHGVGALKNNMLYFALGYSLITFFVIATQFIVVFRLFPKIFDSEKWTIGKEFLNIFFVLVIMAVLGWKYTNKVQIGGVNMEKFSLLAFFKYTFSAFTPIIIYVFLSEFLLDRFRRGASSQIMKDYRGNKFRFKRKSYNAEVKIFANNNKDFIEFNIKNLVYVSSEGNYSSFFIKNENNELQEEVLRLQISKVEEIFKKYKKIVRCHKSYIINTFYAIDLTGNARGYFLHTQLLENPIPVSRKYTKSDILSFLNKD